MDGHAFDRLTRILGSTGSRRTALAALVAASPLAGLLEASAKKRKQRHKNRDQEKNRPEPDRGKGKGKNTGKRKGKAKSQATNCWRSGACVLRKGANASQCNLANYNPTTPPDCTGCNISRANLRGANLRGANLTKANLSDACLIDAILTGATIANNTNMANAVICRTTMPDGSVSYAGCGLGSPCCPVCDANNPCPAGQICCGGRCVTGNCCGPEDCADQTCRDKACTSNVCTYSLQGSGTGGTNCAHPRQCCNGTCCPSGQKCCGDQCIDAGRCCVNNVPDVCPDNGRCCGGECILQTECCTNNQTGCPPDQTCVVHEVSGPACCPTPNACGPRCLTTPCSELCAICNAQTGGCESICQPFVESCCNGMCKVANGEACTQDTDCCQENLEFCARETPSGVKLCCVFGGFCTSNAQCCSGRCEDNRC